MNDSKAATSRKLFCEICNCHVHTNTGSLPASHVSGRKHSGLARSARSRVDSLSRSVYVRGFHGDACGETELAEHFSLFGEVERVYVDKNEMAYAIVLFSSEASVTRALTSDRVPFRGKPLVVRKRRPVNSASDTLTARDVRERNAGWRAGVMEKLSMSGAGELSDEMLSLRNLAHLTTEEVELRHLVRDLLTSVFEEVYPRACVQMFGSTVTQFASTGSDLDVTLLFDEGIPPEGGEQNAASEHHPASADASSADNELDPTTTSQPDNTVMGSHCSVDNISPSAITDRQSDNIPSARTTTASPTLAEMKYILQSHVPHCMNVVMKQSQFCPIVSFTHSESGLHVDLSYNNRLAIENTCLLNSYRSLDSRFIDLVFTIRWWAHVHAITGEPSSPLNNYSLTLLIVFYLQQCTPPVLPCLQDTSVSSRQQQDPCNLIGGWNCRFCKDLEWTSENCSNSGDLLTGFFTFYSLFDFERSVISIHSTERFRRKDITASLKGHATFSLLRLDTPLVILDPFRRTHNVAHNCSDERLRSFLTALKRAQTILADPSGDPSVDQSDANIESMDQSHGSLARLMRVCESPTVADERSRKRKQKKRKSKLVDLNISLPKCRHMTNQPGDSVCTEFVAWFLREDLKMTVSTVPPHPLNTESASTESMSSKAASTKSMSDTKSIEIASAEINTESSDVHPSNIDSIVTTRESSESCANMATAIISTALSDDDLTSAHPHAVKLKRKHSPVRNGGSKKLKSDTISPYQQNESVEKMEDGLSYSGEDGNLHVTAVSQMVTWTGRRKERRQQLRAETGAETSAEMSAETGTETGTEMSAETSAETGAKMSAEMGAETSAETGAETSAETNRVDGEANGDSTMPSAVLLNRGQSDLIRVGVEVLRCTPSSDCRLTITPLGDGHDEHMQTFLAFVKKTIRNKFCI